MHCVAVVQSSPREPEIAILKLDSRELKALHKNPLGFVNDNHVFCKSVKRAEIAPRCKTQTGYAMVVHLPKCTCVVYDDLGPETYPL
jgi:hypothetical protein